MKKHLWISLSIVLIGTTAFGQYSQSIQFDTLSTPVFKPLNLIYLSSNPILMSIKSKETYMPGLGKFCLWEEEFSKSAGRPVKFRLGSQDYVDKLENKRN